MAGSRYQYVKEFEVGDSKLLPKTWIVIRLDGKGFSKLSSLYNFEKPNDIRALNLMNEAAMVSRKSVLSRLVFLEWKTITRPPLTFHSKLHIYTHIHTGGNEGIS
jgi:tRNA(His) 5'-end guanylyltransferase